ncbi:hypothetical protein KGP93_27565, partial [Burkholderia multivorans]|nr:hypothetical protein [Burkholderia multivorans]
IQCAMRFESFAIGHLHGCRALDVRMSGGACAPSALALRRRFPVESSIPRASYNGHYLSFPSRNGWSKRTVCAGFAVIFLLEMYGSTYHAGFTAMPVFTPASIKRKLLT